MDNETGLYFYGSRYYDPNLMWFIQADIVVPSLRNPQSFNRYSYTYNNPIRYTDPSGHEPVDTEDYVSNWEWKNRWYEDHGYFWSDATGTWDIEGTAVFADESILVEVLNSTNIFTVDGNAWNGRVWVFDELVLVGQAVARFAQKVGGIEQLKTLLVSRVNIVRKTAPDFHGDLSCSGLANVAGCAVKAIATAFFYDSTFASSDLFARGTIVHELAHLIDFNSSAWFNLDNNNQNLSKGFPKVLAISEYATLDSAPTEYFAEAVAMWVYPYYKSGEVARNGQAYVLDPTQLAYLQIHLAAPGPKTIGRGGK